MCWCVYRELFEHDSNEIIANNIELELNTSDPVGGLQTIVTKILRWGFTDPIKMQVHFT